MEPMMKDLVAKIDALQREVKQLREERNEKV
jgi:outer membrane murein-binding lipoprotein Lpp